jgi:hypothetical protein
MEDYRARVDVKHSKRVPQNQAEGGDEVRHCALKAKRLDGIYLLAP